MVTTKIECYQYFISVEIYNLLNCALCEKTQRYGCNTLKGCKIEVENGGKRV